MFETKIVFYVVNLSNIVKNYKYGDCILAQKTFLNRIFHNKVGRW